MTQVEKELHRHYMMRVQQEKDLCRRLTVQSEKRNRELDRDFWWVVKAALCLCAKLVSNGIVHLMALYFLDAPAMPVIVGILASDLLLLGLLFGDLWRRRNKPCRSVLWHAN